MTWSYLPASPRKTPSFPALILRLTHSKERSSQNDNINLKQGGKQTESGKSTVTVDEVKIMNLFYFMKQLSYRTTLDQW